MTNISLRMNGLRRIVRAAGAIAAVVALSAFTSLPRSAVRVDTATFAGGCFWSVEKLFDETPGVISAVSGFMGGTVANPSYNQVVTGRTGHAESVQVIFDPARVSYAQLVAKFWRNIDPTAVNRQFCDPGSQYRTAIFYHDAEQRRVAESSKQALEQSGRFERVATVVVPAQAFYRAEEYHQDYARKNPGRYNMYRIGCGRDRRLRELWGGE